MAVITSIALVGAAVIGGVVQADQAGKRARSAGRAADKKEQEILNFEANRQSIPNPYADYKDVSSMATDLSVNMTNEFANLGVATQAAKFQAEQDDMALSNTLDTLRATGSGSGGATSLAQAALQSKMGVSAV